MMYMMASTRLSWIYVLLALLGVVFALPEPGKLQLTKQSRYVFLHSFIHSRFLLATQSAMRIPCFYVVVDKSNEVLA
jgi:hypothetical protein